jgi:hypothetical protein
LEIEYAKTLERLEASQERISTLEKMVVCLNERLDMITSHSTSSNDSDILGLMRAANILNG